MASGAQHIPGNGNRVNAGLGGDFAEEAEKVAFDGAFNRDPAVRVLGQAGIEDNVIDPIADLLDDHPRQTVRRKDRQEP